MAGNNMSEIRQLCSSVSTSFGCRLSGLWSDLMLPDGLFPRAIARYGSQSEAASCKMISRPQSRTLEETSAYA